MISHLDKHLRTLTRHSKASESAVQGALAAVLGEYGEVITEHQTGDGPCDMFLPARRVVIEVKERPKSGDTPSCGPDLPGSRAGETQFEQLRRYVLALRRKEQQTLWEGLTSPNTPWIGALTDGSRWWAWEWTATGDDLICTEMRLLHEQNYNQSPLALAPALTQLANRSAGKPWVPADPTDLFRSLRDRLEVLWREAGDRPSAKTQHQLWHDLVRGSGIEVNAARRYPLFLDHCLLVALARYVSRVLDGQPYAPPEDGFIAWIADAPGGSQWSQDLFNIVDRYDWGSREIDVLRNVYQAIVPKADRKLYGEYYTPDWLAHLIVEETFDDDWLRESILAAYAQSGPPPGIGALDPTCSSGTFLFHVARRIVDAIPRFLPSGDRKTHARIASWLVHGIDIHPVAVEMARATLRRALPASVDVSVHQGDALLMADTETAGLTGRLFDAGSSEFRSPDGKHSFHIPHSFTDRPDFSQRLDDLVSSARDDRPLPDSVTFGLPGDDIEWLQDAHETLTEIVKSHGDGVWAWYIRNQLMPRAIARRKVNRIVSNPPWLRWSEIQTEPRKSDMKIAAEARGIFPDASQAQTGFDIAALFVVESRQIYLNDAKGDPSAYVLNGAAINSNNWQRFRLQGHARGILEIAEMYADCHVLRPRPFTGVSRCCVIGMRGRSGLRLILKDAEQRFSADVMSLPNELVAYIPAIPEPTWQPSVYAKRPRQGATIVPAVLTRIDPNQPDRTLQPRSAKHPWSKLAPFPITDIGQHWRTEFVGPDQLEHFTITRPLSAAVIPREGDMLLDDAAAQKASANWRALSRAYLAHRAVKAPEELTAYINYSGKLESQMPPSLSVFYNTSGSWLRAAMGTAIISSDLYRVPVASLDEGDYLCSILNAPPPPVSDTRWRGTATGTSTRRPLRRSRSRSTTRPTPTTPCLPPSAARSARLGRSRQSCRTPRPSTGISKSSATSSADSSPTSASSLRI